MRSRPGGAYSPKLPLYAEFKLYELDCSSIGDPWRNDNSPLLSFKVEEANLKLVIYGDDEGPQGRAERFRTGQHLDKPPTSYHIETMGGSRFHISFVTHTLAHGYIIWNYVPDHGMLTRTYTQFELKDEPEPGKIPSREVVVAESHFCMTWSQMRVIADDAIQWLSKASKPR